MYQENSQRKWQSSSPVNPPLDLKTFLQKRIRAIMAKEWWDFIVNVNTLNGDHASLLYSLANLCPSFNYFLQTRDKELQMIIKKRPVVKPRIFSGSERLDTTPEPIVPKQMPLVTRRNSANELVKILNELYPNENNSKVKQSRTYGPASKQKKLTGPAKKNVINNIPGEVTKKNSPPQAIVGRSPLLKRLLADESQKENAHITNVKKMPQQLLSLPVLLDENEAFSKAILSNTNYDLNQNRLNQQSPRKIKKIIKVKKKRYVFSNSLTADSKHRLKYILEDETPNLSLKLIKKYRIKKCTVDLVRLKDSVLKYYEDLRRRNYEQLCLSLDESSSSVPNVEMQFSTSEVTDQQTNLNVNTNSPLTDLPSEKDEEVSEISVPNFKKENAPVVEKLNPKELKNVYCHGGIVPLGKLLMSDKLGTNKHFLSLKEKKLRENSNDAAIFLKPRDVSLKAENGEIENKNINSNNTLSDLERLQSLETSTIKSPVGDTMEVDNPDDSSGNNNLNDTKLSIIADKEAETVQPKSDKIVSESENLTTSSIVKSDISDSVESNLAELPVLNVSNSCNKNLSDIINGTASVINCNENMTVESKNSNNEAPVFNGEKSLDINDVELTIPCEKPDEEVKNKTIPEIGKLIGINDKLDTVDDLSVLNSEQNKNVEKVIQDTLLNRTEENEPLAKRPRFEINLMKLEITKTLMESGNKDDRVCKMCKLSFDSVESWNEHFENEVPKCTPNLQVSWDNPELSLLTDKYSYNSGLV